MFQKKYSKFKSGAFSPQNKDKYKGTFPIVFRSSWEKQLMIFLDNSAACISWGSESNIVSYTFGNKTHRYFIDFSATFKDKNGALQKYLIEVKPFKETIEPKRTPKSKELTYLKVLSTYRRNCAKWTSAKEHAQRKGYKFIILTEKELFTEKIINK